MESLDSTTVVSLLHVDGMDGPRVLLYIASCGVRDTFPPSNTLVKYSSLINRVLILHVWKKLYIRIGFRVGNGIQIFCLGDVLV